MVKNLIKMILFFLVLGISFVSKPMEQQSQESVSLALLPPELKAVIVQALATSGTISEAIANIKKLRLVNQEFKSLIDDPVIGRNIMQLIADRIPADPEQIRKLFNLGSHVVVNREKFILRAALQLGNQGAIEWIKKELKQNPAFKNQAQSYFIYATGAGLLQAFDMLIKADIDVNAKDGNYNAIIVAAQQEKPEIIERLLQPDANLNL